MSTPLRWTPDPFLPVPSPEIIQRNGPEWLEKIYNLRENAARLAKDDPLRYGHELTTWTEAREILQKARFLLCLGGNGSAKTYFLARSGVEVLTPEVAITSRPVLRPRRMDNPPEALWLSTNETVSLQVQRYVYRHLPPEYRPEAGAVRRRNETLRVNFNPSTGFGNRTFALPTGAIGTFGTYHQWFQDDQCFEGLKLNFIGLDEDAPLQLIETLYERLFERDGIMVQTFTPIDGVTPAIREFTAGAVTLKSQRAELLPEDHRVSVYQDFPEGHLPALQKATRAKTFIMYWPTKANPASEYEMRVEEKKGQPTSVIEARFYGYARNTVAGRFPYFGDNHLVEPADIPAEGTNYHILDLGEARNFVMIWVRVCDDGITYVYDEWPDVDSMGWWAVPSKQRDKFDGDEGPAQRSRGYSIEDYKRIIRQREGWVERNGVAVPGLGGVQHIEERLIDPRAGNSEKTQRKGGALTVIEMFGDTDESGPWRDPLYFIGAAGKDEAEGIQAVNNLLRYEPGQPLVRHFNHPRLMVSRKCRNLEWALRNYTGQDGAKAACKDFTDVLRYFATGNCEYIAPRTVQHRRGGGYGGRKYA